MPEKLINYEAENPALSVQNPKDISFEMEGMFAQAPEKLTEEEIAKYQELTENFYMLKKIYNQDTAYFSVRNPETWKWSKLYPLIASEPSNFYFRPRLIVKDDQGNVTYDEFLSVINYERALQKMKELLGDGCPAVPETDTEIDRGTWQDQKDENQDEKPTPPEEIESKEKESWDGAWIKEVIAWEIKEIKNTRPKDNWSAERNEWSQDYESTYENGNIAIDKDRHIVWIATRWREAYAPCAGWLVDVNNRCEYDWEKWKIYAYVNDNYYELPLNIKWLKLDKEGNPVNNLNNREIIQFFARIWNLINCIKNRAVFNDNTMWAALEYSNGGIEVNNWRWFWIWDDEEMSKGGFNELEQKYSHICKLWKDERIGLACIFTAMKYDLGHVTWKQIEKQLDKKHEDLVKRYSYRWKSENNK